MTVRSSIPEQSQLNSGVTPIKMSLLTGGKDPHYALGLLSGLVSKGVNIEFIGNDEMKDADIVRSKNVTYFNLRGDQGSNASVLDKIVRVLKYYFKLMRYTVKSDSKLFHILWLNKFIYFDSTFLNVFYKLMGKKIVFTAHNVNLRERDEKNTVFNRLTLKFMYHVVDHIFVHTEKMKVQLMEDFIVNENKVTVIPFGMNNIVPQTALSRMEARRKLKLTGRDKIMLFFGNIAPYKGLDCLIWTLPHLKRKINDFKLIITGRIKNSEAYWENIRRIIKEHDLRKDIIERIEYIPDEEIEFYFKSADVLILPYKNIYQSGVLFLSYSFGLPVIATDVGSLKEYVIEGKTGFICQPENPQDLAEKICLYFDSELFKNLEVNRKEIMQYAAETCSWDMIAEKTHSVYKSVLSSV